MKIIILLIITCLIIIIPLALSNSYASHQNTSCSVSITSDIIPIKYITENRNNPNGSFYAGDGFHYLITSKGSKECLSFSIKPMVSEGIFDVLSHQNILWNKSTPTNHSHDDFTMKPKYMTTKHYYVDKINHCRNNNENCQSLVLADNPSHSIREDKKPSLSLQRLLDGSRTASTYALRIEETQDWGFTNFDGSHSHDGVMHKTESDSSIKSFEKYVKSKCNIMPKYQTCTFGHVEIGTEKLDEKCMFAELEKMGIKHNIKSDFCVKIKNTMSLTIQGSYLSCNDNKCKIKKVIRTKSINPNILSSEFEILLSDPPVKDKDNYDGKNKDGTYYPHDPIGVIHKPSLLWKDHRSETIQFVTTKQHDLKKEYDFDCNSNKCDHMLTLKTVYPATINLGNGDGITIYNSTINDFGTNSYQYTTTMSNLGRHLHTTHNEITSETVDYNPKFESHPYPLLKDNKEFAFDDRQGVVLHYFGSEDDNIIHEKRRSKINYVYNVGIGWNYYETQVIHQNFTLHEGVTITKDTLLSHNETAVFSQSGYGKLYFEYPLTDIVIHNSVPRYENVTSFTTLISDDFAGKDTILDHYSMRYPEYPFTKNVIIKSINQNGTIMYNDKIELEIIPYLEIGSEYINKYIYDKMKFDTNDETLSKTISNDIYPMTQKYYDTGILNTTISKTSLMFNQFTHQVNANNTLSSSNQLIDVNDMIHDSPESLRLSTPYDIGLSASSPTSLIITIDDNIHILQDMHFSFGEKLYITVNAQKDNVLQAHREIGKITVYEPTNFGSINSVYIDDVLQKSVTCYNTQCMLLFSPNKEIKLSVENRWGGVASVVLPEIIPSIPPTVEEPNNIVIILVISFLIMAYGVYKIRSRF